MVRVFDGQVQVGYHTASLLAAGNDGGSAPEACFAGQANGLCGVAVPGMIMFTTGLHSGPVAFSVDVLDAAPPLDDAWEEIVEASFIKEGADELTLCDFDGPNAYPVPLKPGTYRVRFCARGMDAGAKADTLVDEEPVDFYSLAFWSAAEAPDVVLKQTSERAAYWHQAYGAGED